MRSHCSCLPELLRVDWRFAEKLRVDVQLKINFGRKQMRQVLLALLALFALTATPMVYADDEQMPEVPAVDTEQPLPPLTGEAPE